MNAFKMCKCHYTYLKKPTENLVLKEPLSALLLNKIHT